MIRIEISGASDDQVYASVWGEDVEPICKMQATAVVESDPIHIAYTDEGLLYIFTVCMEYTKEGLIPHVRPYLELEPGGPVHFPCGASVISIYNPEDKDVVDYSLLFEARIPGSNVALFGEGVYEYDLDEKVKLDTFDLEPLFEAGWDIEELPFSRHLVVD